MKQLFKIEPSRNPKSLDVMQRACQEIAYRLHIGEDFQIVLSEVKRTLDQNAAMWPSLADFQKHVQWMVTDQYGKQQPATTEDVKDILTATFEGETRMAMGLRGGVVILGARTSQYSKRKMGEFLTFLRAEGDERCVQWSAKAKDTFEEYIK